MNVARWKPFSDFESVLRDYNRTGQGLRRADWVPLVDVRERKRVLDRCRSPCSRL